MEEGGKEGSGSCPPASAVPSCQKGDALPLTRGRKGNLFQDLMRGHPYAAHPTDLFFSVVYVTAHIWRGQQRAEVS